jgi:hypothetical protein
MTTREQSAHAGCAHPEEPSLWKELRGGIRAVLPFWIATRVLLLGAGIMVSSTGLLLEAPEEPGWLGVWARWDAIWYLVIAEYGYDSSEPGGHYAQGRQAYFPGMVYATKLVNVVVPDLLASSLVVSAVAGAVALGALHAVTRRQLGAAAAENATVYLVLFPYAVFLFVGYAEALFLGFALTAWLAGIRGQWLVAGLLASGAVLTRVNGIALVCGLAVLFCAQHWPVQQVPPHKGLRHSLFRPQVLWLLLPVLALSAWVIRLRLMTGHWDSYTRALDAGWERGTGLPFEGVVVTARQFLSEFPDGWSRGLELLAGVLLVALLVVLLRRRDWGGAGYTFATLALLLMSSPFGSALRATLLTFPLVMVLGAAGARRRAVHLTILLLFGTTMAVCSVGLAMGAWVG